MVTAERMAKHVEAVAKAHGVTVGSHSSGGRAWRKRRLAWFRPVKSEVTYAIALHEIGHVVGPQGRNRLDSEAKAWQWALENARPAFVGERFVAEMTKCLRSYLRWVCRRNGWIMGETVDGHTIVDTGECDRPRRGCPTLPPADHPFWNLVDGRLR